MRNSSLLHRYRLVDILWYIATLTPPLAVHIIIKYEILNKINNTDLIFYKKIQSTAGVCTVVRLGSTVPTTCTMMVPHHTQ